MTSSNRRIDRLDPRERAWLTGLLRSPRYELMPTPSAQAAIETLAPGQTVTVTASPRKGLDATIDLAIDLVESRLRVVPHVAARQVRDPSHLDKTLHRLTDAGIEELFVIGGDGEPQGDLTDAQGLLRVIEDSGHRFKTGVAGYPEGHPLIASAVLTDALLAKQRFASYVTTQLCFDPGAISAWISQVRDAGVDLPVLIGIAGPVAMRRLLPIAFRIGVGPSIRFLSRHRGLWRRLTTPSYSPTELLTALGPLLTDAALGVEGLHIYTFNQVTATEEWRNELLGRLDH